MKLQRETTDGLNLITAYEATSIAVNRVAHDKSLIVTPETVVEGWAPGGFDALGEGPMAEVAALAPALVLIGTGSRQRFPQPVVLRPLVEAGIGFEVMDTGSACRTYNILAGEGRKVAAALLID